MINIFLNVSFYILFLKSSSSFLIAFLFDLSLCSYLPLLQTPPQVTISEDSFSSIKLSFLCTKLYFPGLPNAAKSKGYKAKWLTTQVQEMNCKTLTEFFMVPLPNQVGLLKGYIEKASKCFTQVRGYCFSYRRFLDLLANSKLPM